MFKNGQEVGRSEGPSPSTANFVNLMSAPFAKK
jgi:hypothetical protein